MREAACSRSGRLSHSLSLSYPADSRSNGNRKSSPGDYARSIRGNIIGVAAPIGNKELREFQANANQFVCNDVGYSGTKLQSNSWYKCQDSVRAEVHELVTRNRVRQEHHWPAVPGKQFARDDKQQ